MKTPNGSLSFFTYGSVVPDGNFEFHAEFPLTYTVQQIEMNLRGEVERAITKLRESDAPTA